LDACHAHVAVCVESAEGRQQVIEADRFMAFRADVRKEHFATLDS
jgi:hypothetical protein